MAIETLDDIVEGLANKLGIYGAHDDEEDDETPKRCTEDKPCRMCWTANLREHLKAAFQVERKLYPCEEGKEK